MHVVAVLALDDVVPSDLMTPLDVFGRTHLPGGGPAYEVRICTPAAEVTTGAFTLRAPWRFDTLAAADTVIIPGREDEAGDPPVAALDAVREAAAAGARIASICSGAFLLAATGLLDGRRATTHWAAAAELARRHPAVTVDPNVLYVDNGQVLTSAGASAGLDLCLHMVRRDQGVAVAARTARLCVAPLERDGGQAQFIDRDPPPPDGLALEPLLRWLAANSHRELTLADIAAHARVSPRTLNRRFREQIGVTPVAWLRRSRLRHAQQLLETTGHPVEMIAAQVGFGSPAAFRERFRELVGTSPRAYRRAFGTGAGTDGPPEPGHVAVPGHPDGPPRRVVHSSGG
ncbi:Transcriptional regulator containing an amidase domain and an AraC-type DNA-binding HTH domain [Frankia canadensis]|uniref:Transcriptional regulator containing an amidase domain and an AraC-type DNA-binding HTH domain n=1 Tax=Frankia canadensis TaxID=1836972 RepID=A0A2I2KUN9_9ACTN|nr:helix-turn-helix domain-containing protein [Frankia canadensis]SNQ49387.1 Transcriptional regulator containing an amidase domain and an AraC-type DNA-binding HTH domain [Frankia canadensis]SOU56677.1 Transcriptional regulator containing an amidase domain and an AraC-type DNA-binding HTH domain [Frankia canadensis]